MNKIILMILMTVVSNVVMAEMANPVFGENRGITWAISKSLASNYVKYYEKQRFCDSMIGGVAGWRLPSVSELRNVAVDSKDNWYLPCNYCQYSSNEIGRFEVRGVTSHVSIRTSSNQDILEGDDVTEGNFACVHSSLLSNGQFTTNNKIYCGFDKPCEISNSVVSIPSKPTQTTSPTSPTSGIQLRADNSAAEKAARDRATAEANRKIEEDATRERLAREKRLADEKRAREEAEAKRRATYTIETRVNDSGQMSKKAAETYCQESIARLRSSFSTGRNQLMSVGACNCNTPNPALEATYCKYSYTYKQYETAAR